MRILRLSLDYWRGIESREVVFSEGVTVIEGPNEIGKSTLVEAIRLLFGELDSSKKQGVKSIKPVDKDVGSTVEVDIESGDYQFTYSKTFNKSTKTSLNILAPTKKQLTGREAHEYAEQLLASTVDMALWEALLVDQGEKVALANIRDSAGLAKALDEAAGSTSSPSEETGLYEAVKAEYENYYTLKTGKPKFSSQEDKYEEANRRFNETRQAVLEVESDSQSYDRCAAQVRRLRSTIPGLNTKLDDYEKQWAEIRSIKEKLEEKQKELDSTKAMQKAAVEAEADRETLVDDIKVTEQRLHDTEKNQEPLRKQSGTLKDRLDKVQLVISDLKKKRASAKQALDLAQSDAAHLNNLEALAVQKGRLELLKGLSKEMKSALEIVGSIKIDDSGLEILREAERAYDIARSKIAAVATKVSVTAEKDLQFEFDDDSVSLRASETETRNVASQLRIRLPSVATVELTPSTSVAEVEEEVAEARSKLDQLQDSLGVSDLKGAVAANERRVTAQGEIDRLKDREAGILGGDSVEEIEQSVKSYQADCDDYSSKRKSTEGFPADVAEATDRVRRAEELFDSHESALEAAREKVEGLQSDFAQTDGKLRIAQQELAGIEAALKEKQVRLDKAQLAEADADLGKRVSATEAAVSVLQEEVKAMQITFTESSPDSVEELRGNAKDVFDRAKADLQKEEQNLAVLADRLQHAQADGRFEAMDAAEREFEHQESLLNSTHRRVAAVQFLWATLNTHRDAARKAYVAPLRQAIERLGKIVFGAEVEVEIGDDWSLVSRTLNGKTLPFNDLSVGAKEQLGILTRLAAAQIVSKQGGVPLVIDDALGFSDPSRLETMGAAIAAAGRQCQIIILTCTPGRFTHVGNAEVIRF